MSFNYLFPIIMKIDDVLPHIHDRPEFIVADRGPLTVINYAYAGPDSFPTIAVPNGSNDSLKERILRECRGLIFDTKTGLLESRRYHKFFNYGEREDIDFDPTKHEHVVYDKLDGSMVSPIFFDDPQTRRYGWRMATKMGITSISLQVEDYLTSLPSNVRKKYYDFFEDMQASSATPIFEWISRKNRIILDYGSQDHLILTAIRYNTTGEYSDARMELTQEIPSISPLDKIQIDSMQEFVNYTRSLKKIEGFVIRTNNGHMLKFKTDEYVLFHKTKDSLSRECDVAKICLDNKVDDFLSCLHDKDQSAVKSFAREISQQFLSFANECRRERNVWDDRKEFALSFPNSVRKQAIFAIWNGQDDPIESVRKILLSHCENKKKFDQMKKEVFPSLPKIALDNGQT